MYRSVYLFLAYVVVASAQQSMPTPYDPIRPVWPLIWDEAAYKSIDVDKGKIPAEATPVVFQPGAFLPDTTSQAYLDAMNVKISPIRVNQAGYRPDDVKYIYYVGSATTFQVVKAFEPSVVVGSGTFTKNLGTTASSIAIRASNNATTTKGGDTRYTVAGTGPSGSLQEGILPTGLPLNERLRVKVGDQLSADFIISPQVYSMVKDATLKFFGVNRSGNSESWFHKPSHLKDPIPGGWYDCGDHLKESITQSGTMAILGMLAAIYPDRDTDKYAYNQGNTVNLDGIPDILREAKHGADYFLYAYNKNNKKVDANLHLSVGDFGKDHGWWGSPEYQDPMPMDRGGAVSRQALRNDLWSTTAGRIAAGLAFVASQYHRFDSAFASQALEAAKAFYAYGRANLDAGSSEAYNGESAYYDDMALAAVALLNATGENQYLQDLAYDPTLGDKASSAFPKGGFPGGWFAHTNPSFTHEKNNTDWARFETLALFAFYKLVLETESKAKKFGITSDRVRLQRNVAYSLAMTLGQISLGTETIVLPASDMGWLPGNGFVKHGSPWFEQYTNQEWVWNRYHFGNIVDMMVYAEVLKDLSGLDGLDWKERDVLEVGIRQLDYMLGVNPWDISMIYGIGSKNFAHPHHRAANPEGRNVPGASYKYRPPVGALQGGFIPGGTSAYTEHYDDYYHSEVCIDGSMMVMIPATIMAKDEDLNVAPDISVEIKYVGYDSAIVVVKQSAFGSTVIHYGTDPLNLKDSVYNKTNGVVHTLVLKPLINGTTYYFIVTSTNARSGNSSQQYLIEADKIPFTFTTLNSPPGAADIQNVKVCNVSADSAEFMWFTPNGEYESKIYWDEQLRDPKSMAHSLSGDVSGVPTRFHYIKIGGLKEKTTYYYAVESNGTIRSTDENGQPLQFTTPVTQMKFDVRVSSYTWGGLPALTFNLENNEPRSYDSLEMRVYLRDGPDLDKNLGVRFDICQAYDEAGFNNPCADKTIGDQAKKIRPIRMDDTYDASTNTWIWYLTLPLGSTEVKAGSRIRYDAMLDTRSPFAPYEDLMNQAPQHKPGTGDWTWDAHSRANGDPADYSGLPVMEKDIMDIMPHDVPINPYVTVYRKGEFVWGFSPSYAEQSTKRAHYEILTEFEAPYHVPNGSYVKLDAASSTIRLKGKAYITEAGHVTDIWVNGKRIPNLADVAKYNITGNHWDLDIPVKLTIGANKIDVTVFAGPPTDCLPCQENGGCAFDNRNYFIQFSKGNRTASSLRLVNESGNPVSSPVDPSKLGFHIVVMDKDNAGKGSVAAWVINARKLDTLKVTLTELASTPGEFKSTAMITTKDMAFFGGDTLYVRYIDVEDEEDIAEQIVYADPAYPLPLYALALDANCDGKMDSLRVVFSSPFSAGDSFDSLWISVRHPITLQGDSFKVAVPQPIVNQDMISIPMPNRAGLPITSAPAGYVATYLKSGEGDIQVEKAPIKDGIAPVLKGVALLENPPYGLSLRMPQDTLKISFSEPVSLSSLNEWPLLLVDSLGNAVDASGLKVIGKATSHDNGLSWLYVVEGNDAGLLIKDGMNATIKGSFTVIDLALNPLDDLICNEPVRVTETPRPVPIRIASISDLEGDGYPDEVRLTFERKLRTKDMLDSFVVGWGNPVIYRSYLSSDWVHSFEFGTHTEMQGTEENPASVIVTDTLSVLTIQIPDQKGFPYGTTYGYQNGFGTVTPRLGPEGGFFDKSYAMADQCAPVILYAMKSRDKDSVGIILSEPLDTLQGGYYLERRRDSVFFEPLRAFSLDNKKSYVFYYDMKTSPGAPRLGDWVRLAPTSMAKYSDQAKNIPTIHNPWVELKGSAKDLVTFHVEALHSLSNVSDRTPEVAYQGKVPLEKEWFRLTLVNPKTKDELHLVSGARHLEGTVPTDIFNTTTYHHLGPTFQIDMIMPSALHEVAGQFVWDYRIHFSVELYDNMGQYVNTTAYSFDLSAIGREHISEDGTLRFMLEWLVPETEKSPLSVKQRAVSTGAYIGSFDFKADVTYLSDGSELTESSVVRYQKGDKVRIKDSDRLIFGVKR